MPSTAPPLLRMHNLTHASVVWAAHELVLVQTHQNGIGMQAQLDALEQQLASTQAELAAAQDSARSASLRLEAAVQEVCNHLPCGKAIGASRHTPSALSVIALHLQSMACMQLLYKSCLRVSTQPQMGFCKHRFIKHSMYSLQLSPPDY